VKLLSLCSCGLQAGKKSKILHLMMRITKKKKKKKAKSCQMRGQSGSGKTINAIKTRLRKVC
jgi:hypothetical protein